MKSGAYQQSGVKFQLTGAVPVEGSGRSARRSAAEPSSDLGTDHPASSQASTRGEKSEVGADAPTSSTQLPSVSSGIFSRIFFIKLNRYFNFNFFLNF